MAGNKTRKVAKSTVSIVGAGRLGTALALALAASGYRILALVSRRSAKASKAAALLGGSTRSLNAKQLSQIPPSDLILIATPDDAISTTARELSLSAGRPQGATVLHTSGALSSVLLSPLAKAGFYTGSIHPLVSVSNARQGAESLRGAFYCIEGDRSALGVARSLVRDLGGQSFSLPANKKALYHAAAVMSSGHVTALFDIATEMLVACGLSKTAAHKVLIPLIKSTASNLDGSTPARALTGTFARGDVATVVEHLKALDQNQCRVALVLYKLLGSRSIEIAKRRRMDPTLLKRMQRALSSQSDE